MQRMEGKLTSQTSWHFLQTPLQASQLCTVAFWGYTFCFVLELGKTKLSIANNKEHKCLYSWFDTHKAPKGLKFDDFKPYKIYGGLWD